MTDSSSQIAIVTGAGGDIGRAIAFALCAADHHVVAVDLNAETVEATAEALQAEGYAASAIQCDVTDPGAVAEMADKARQFGGICVLINNAGGITAASLQEADAQSFRRDLALNLEAGFSCFKTVESDLKRSKGCVVNIASVNGIGAFGHPGYSSAKAGLIHLTRMIAVEYGRFGIRANAVAPGTVRTRAWEDRLAQNPDLLEDVKRWYPLQRIATAEDVANTVAFLVSEQAQAISGVCLEVDCGLTAGQTELARAFSLSPDY